MAQDFFHHKTPPSTIYAWACRWLNTSSIPRIESSRTSKQSLSKFHIAVRTDARCLRTLHIVPMSFPCWIQAMLYRNRRVLDMKRLCSNCSSSLNCKIVGNYSFFRENDLLKTWSCWCAVDLRWTEIMKEFFIIKLNSQWSWKGGRKWPTQQRHNQTLSGRIFVLNWQWTTKESNIIVGLVWQPAQSLRLSQEPSQFRELFIKFQLFPFDSTRIIRFIWPFVTEMSCRTFATKIVFLEICFHAEKLSSPEADIPNQNPFDGFIGFPVLIWPTPNNTHLANTTQSQSKRLVKYLLCECCGSKSHLAQQRLCFCVSPTKAHRANDDNFSVFSFHLISFPSGNFPLDNVTERAESLQEMPPQPYHWSRACWRCPEISRRHNWLWSGSIDEARLRHPPFDLREKKPSSMRTAPA